MKKSLKSQPWWEAGQGLRVHVGLDDHFGQCWDRYSGEALAWEPTVRELLYSETIQGDWERLIADAIAYGESPAPTEEEKAKWEKEEQEILEQLDRDRHNPAE